MQRDWFHTNEEFYAAVIKGIHMSWDRLRDSYKSPYYPKWKAGDFQNPEYHICAEKQREVCDCRLFLYWLFDTRKAIQAGVFPEMRKRQNADLGRRITDCWDWKDPVAKQLIRIFNDYLHDEYFGLKEIPAPEPDIENIKSEFEKWDKQYLVEQAKERELELQRRREYFVANNWRVMPHLPDPGSMSIQRRAALEHRKEHNSAEKLSKAVSEHDYDWFNRFANYSFIEGYTDYLVKQPLHVVAAHLRQGCEYANLAIEHGFEPHAWYINDYLHEAIAVNHPLLAQRLTNLRQEDWDTDRIRPVNWLVTQIKLVMEMYAGRDEKLASLIETNRKGLFEEKLAPELEVDLPMMRNMYHLLRALAKRNEPAFNKHLAERMPLREAHFTRGGTIAPIALIDVHALALCRIARNRGLTPSASHVYLPLELLDA